MKVLYSINLGGNVHDAVSQINKRLPELAEYVLQIDFSGGNSVVVFCAPKELIDHMFDSGGSRRQRVPS